MFVANLIIHKCVSTQILQLLAQVDAHLVPLRAEFINLGHLISVRTHENADPISFLEWGAVAFAGEIVEARPNENQSQEPAQC